MPYSQYKINGKIQKKGNLVYYNFSITQKGIRKRARVLCLPSTVRKIYEKWYTEKILGETKPILFKNAIKQYLTFTKEAKSPSENTKILLYLGHLSPIYNKEIKEITNHDIHSSLFLHPYKNPNTHNRRLNVVGSFLNWCELQGYGTSSKILRGLRRSAPESKPVLLRKEQIHLMINRCKYEHQKTFVLLALFTDMRHGEILKLKWSDIDFDSSMITLPGTMTKNKKARHIPLIPQLKKYLQQLKQECEFVVSFMGKPTTTFIKSWKTIGKDICRIHDLRHNFATMLVISGMPIRVAQSALGHSSSKMTEYYSQISKDVMTTTAKNFSNKLGQQMDNNLF